MSLDTEGRSRWSRDLRQATYRTREAGTRNSFPSARLRSERRLRL